jgi:hypothetical protein
MTMVVKMMDSQRCDCRIHLLGFMGLPLIDKDSKPRFELCQTVLLTRSRAEAGLHLNA